MTPKEEFDELTSEQGWSLYSLYILAFVFIFENEERAKAFVATCKETAEVENSYPPIEIF